MGSFTNFVIQLPSCRTSIGAAALLICITNLFSPDNFKSELEFLIDFVIQSPFCRTLSSVAALSVCITKKILPSDVTNTLQYFGTSLYLYYRYAAAFPENAGICITHRLQMESEVIRWAIYQYAALTVAVTCCTYIQRTLIFAILVVILSGAMVLRILVIWI